MAHSSRAVAWLKQGLCSMCGQRPPVTGGKSCQRCRDYHKKGMCKCGRSPVAGGRNCELCRSRTREHNRRIRDRVILGYGGYKCACCGETTPEFLQIDHINDDGAEHRRQVGTGNAMYCWLIRNNFPEGFQVLCANCNYAKEFYGGCPHQKDKEVGRDECRRKVHKKID